MTRIDPPTDLLTAHLYLRRAELLEVTDGDTFRANVDLGFNCWQRIKCRILEIDTPERHGATRRMGDLAAVALEDLIRHADGVVLVETQKADGDQSFDRWLCRVWVWYPAGQGWLSVAHMMIERGFARAYDGKGPRLPWDPTLPYPIAKQGPLK